MIIPVYVPHSYSSTTNRSQYNEINKKEYTINDKIISTIILFFLVILIYILFYKINKIIFRKENKNENKKWH